MCLMHRLTGPLLAGLMILVGCATAPPPPTSISTPVSAPEPPAPRDSTVQLEELSAQGPFQPNLHLFTCYPQLANAPVVTSERQVVNFAPMIVVNGVALASAPSNEACLSSGFGVRYGRPHKGIDLAAPLGSPVYAAAPGIVREVSLARGYGNQIVIDHGRGVFTRYAHLAGFANGLRPGQRVGFGVEIGSVGQTGNATGPHLHYEVLTGSYATPRGSFGLDAHNPLEFPHWPGLSAAS